MPLQIASIGAHPQGEPNFSVVSPSQACVALTPARVPLDVHGKRILERSFEPGFRIRLHRKDLGIALQTGREMGVSIFATAQAAEMMDALMAQGKGELDHSALALLVEQLSGIEG